MNIFIFLSLYLIAKGLDMNKKCDKYEAMSVFASYDDFQKHLSDCTYCQEEHLKMKKVSSLISEVAPIYLARERRMKLKKVMSCCVFLFFGLASIIGLEINNYVQGNGSHYQNSVTYDAGLPVDEYGLVKI